MRTRRGLRVVLHRKKGKLPMANTLDCTVVQIQVGHLKRRRSRHAAFISNYREAMVLSGDQHLIGPNVAHRMIPATVAVRQLRSRATVRQTHELVPQADPEGWQTGA